MKQRMVATPGLRRPECIAVPDGGTPARARKCQFTMTALCAAGRMNA